MSGWVKVHRKISNSKWGKNLEMLGFWTYLLLNANHKECYDADGVLIKRGQIKTGRKRISQELRLNESKTERFLKRLENEQQIEQQKTSKYRIITITNWDKYQDGEQQNEQQANNKRTTNEQQANTNKNDKNEKNDKNIKNNSAELPDGEDKNFRENLIGEFWNALADDCNLPKIKIPLTADRIKKMKGPLQEFPEREDWEKIILEIPKNKFNLGENDRNWKANFDWLFYPTKFNYRKLWEASNA